MDQKKMGIGNIGGGALAERFDLELQEVLKNVRDPNTDAKKARSITIKVEIIPNEDRTAAAMKHSVKSSLAPAKTRETGIMFGIKNGEYIVKEIGNQVPGQIGMSNVLEMNGGKE